MRLDSQAHEVKARVSPAKTQSRKEESGSEALRLCVFAGEKSPILDALGPGSFAEFKAVMYPGTILWCNFDLLRSLGFSVPHSNQLTPRFTQQLLDTFSLRASENVNGHASVTLYADKYGGDGVTPALGAGRAGFLAQGNLYIKGLGFTPLFRHNDKDDFVHSHGGVHLEDCISEAIFGEVNHNLFTLGANRIVAIIDQGKHVTEPSGRKRHIALAIRTGGQLRPGHLLAKRLRGGLELFIRMTRASKQLVLRDGLPDVRATMLRVIDDHAQTAADSFRWRLIHGALSPSNMDISGAMLDLPTQSTQPRTAPIFKLDSANFAFGSEHTERGFYLAVMYRRVLRSLDAETRERMRINVAKEMDQAYERHLRVKLIAATGIKSELACLIASQHPELAARFTNVLLQLAALKNVGSVCVARRVVEDVSVVDVFNLLANAPRGLSQRSAVKHLRPVYKGNRFHVAKKKESVASLAREFVKIYAELMQACLEHGGDYYDDREAMIASITARAEFENAPIDQLYNYKLYERLNRAIAEYKSTGNVDRIRELIDTCVAQSLRSVDGLLAQGDVRLLPDGCIEVERRTIRGIAYSVRAWNNRRKLHIGGKDFDPPALIGRVDGYTYVIPDRQELSRFFHAKAQRGRKGAKVNSS